MNYTKQTLEHTADKLTEKQIEFRKDPGKWFRDNTPKVESKPKAIPFKSLSKKSQINYLVFQMASAEDSGARARIALEIMEINK